MPDARSHAVRFDQMLRDAHQQASDELNLPQEADVDRLLLASIVAICARDTLALEEGLVKTSIHVFRRLRTLLPAEKFPLCKLRFVGKLT